MKRGTVLVGVVALVLAGAHVLVPPDNPLDEYLPLVAAERILAGEVPYRDFTSLYPPLTALLDAGIFRVAGPSLLLARLLFVLLSVVGVGLVKSIGERLSGSERAGALVGLLAASALGAPHWGYALVPAAVLILAAFRVSLLAGEEKRAALAAGALLGLAALARHDAAFWAAIPLGALHATRSRRSVLLFLGATAVPGLLLLAALAVLGALPDAFHQLIVIPGTLYAKIRGLPLPRPWGAPGDAENVPSLGCIYGPFVVSGLALARAWKTGRDPAKLAGAALPFFLGVSSLVRPDRAHLYAATLASFAALALLADAGWKQIGLALALTLPFAGLELYEAARSAKRTLVKREGLLPTGARARIVARLAERPAGSRLYVGLQDHRRIWINDVALYFDAGALPATRHHELYPLVATTRAVQEEMVRDLERTRPPLVVLEKLRIAKEPNASAVTFDVTVLDDYLASHYELDREEEIYRVLRRRPG